LRAAEPYRYFIDSGNIVFLQLRWLWPSPGVFDSVQLQVEPSSSHNIPKSTQWRCNAIIFHPILPYPVLQIVYDWLTTLLELLQVRAEQYKEFT
jgi:hypothetical protein